MDREKVRRSGAMAVIASCALVVLTACGSGAGEEAHEQVTRVPVMSDAAAQATREAASGATPGAGGEAEEAAMEVTVVSNDIFFEPTELTIPANTNVKFILPNEGAAAHDFSIDALDMAVSIAPGDTKEVIVNAPAGTYEFYCSVPGHKQAGMVGTLTVTGDAAAAPAAASPVAEAGATPLASPAAASEGATPVAEASADATPGAATPVAEGAPATQIQIVADDIFFAPEDVTIPADRDVTLTLRNEGVAAHNFSIDALGIDVPLPPGEETEITVNAPAGEYEYYCTEPGHKDIGMVGTLIVTGDAAATPAVSPDEGAPAAEETTGADPAAGEDSGAAVSAEPVTVVSHDIFFDPKENTIPADTDVTVMLPNEGVTLHDFSIDELGIKVDIAPGETQEVVINAPAGTYEYYCSVPGHKAAGMVGTLTVTGDGAVTASAPAEEAAPAADDAPAAEEGAGAASAEPVTVASYDIYFEPKEFSLPADTDVTVLLPNEGVTLHDFTIDELGIAVSIEPGQTQEVVINAPAGTYEYYCSVPGHKAAGMVGTLTVG